MDFNFVWVLIPITAILAGTLKDYFKIRAQQRQLGADNRRAGEGSGRHAAAAHRAHHRPLAATS